MNTSKNITFIISLNNNKKATMTVSSSEASKLYIRGNCMTPPMNNDRIASYLQMCLLTRPIDDNDIRILKIIFSWLLYQDEELFLDVAAVESPIVAFNFAVNPLNVSLSASVFEALQLPDINNSQKETIH